MAKICQCLSYKVCLTISPKFSVRLFSLVFGTTAIIQLVAMLRGHQFTPGTLLVHFLGQFLGHPVVALKISKGVMK